jgi:hypothetical protein
MKTKDISEQIASLKEALNRVRRESLNATRLGDYRAVARLTTEASNINKAILEAQGQMMEFAR